MQGGVPQAAIGPYRLLGELSRGATSVVYRALAPSGEEVALKLVEARGDHQQARFRAEVEAARQLEHPCLVRVRDAGQAAGQAYLVMDLVRGESLAARLQRGPLRAGEAAELLRKLAEGVEHAHQRGLLHRDLTPNNVLIQASGDPVLIDFGLVRELDSGAAGLTQAGATTGTPGYLPPEQAAGKRALIGVPSDVYGLGAVLYAALTGRPPIEGESWVEILAATCQQEPVAPSLLESRVGPELEALCLRCLRKDPAERPQRAGEVAAALADYLDCGAARPDPGRGGLARGAALGAPALLAAGALALLAAGALALGLRRPAPLPEPPLPRASPAAAASRELSLDEAERLAAAGEPARASALLERILAEAPTPPALTLAGRLARGAGRPQEALEQARAALALDPDWLPARLLLGELQVERASWAEAAQTLRRATRQDPGRLAAWELLARVELELRAWSECVAAVERALALDAASVPGLVVRRELASLLGRHDLALEALSLLLAREPTRARRLLRVRALALAGEPGRAGAELRALLPLAPEERPALAGALGELRATLDRPGPLSPDWLAGVAQLLEALTPQLRGQERTEAAALLGHALGARGDRAGALAALRRAAERDPAAAAMAGTYALGLGRAAEAEELLSRGREDPGAGPACRAALSLLAARRGDARAALGAALADWRRLGARTFAFATLRRLIGQPAAITNSGALAEAVAATPALAPGAPLGQAEERLLLIFLQRCAEAPVDFDAAVAFALEEAPDLRLVPELSYALLLLRAPERALAALRALHERARTIPRLEHDSWTAAYRVGPERALELARSSASSHPLLRRRWAALEASDGDEARARALYEGLIADAPEDWGLRNNLGFMLTEGEPELALRHAQLAVSGGRNLETLDTLGWALYRLERYAEAEEQLRAALALGSPAEACIHRLHLCATLLARGRREEARRELRLAELVLPVAEELAGRDAARREALLARLRRELGP